MKWYAVTGIKGMSYAPQENNDQAADHFDLQKLKDEIERTSDLFQKLEEGPGDTSATAEEFKAHLEHLAQIAGHLQKKIREQPPAEENGA